MAHDLQNGNNMDAKTIEILARQVYQCPSCDPPQTLPHRTSSSPVAPARASTPRRGAFNEVPLLNIAHDDEVPFSTGGVGWRGSNRIVSSAIKSCGLLTD